MDFEGSFMASQSLMVSRLELHFPSDHLSVQDDLPTYQFLSF